MFCEHHTEYLFHVTCYMNIMRIIYELWLLALSLQKMVIDPPTLIFDDNSTIAFGVRIKFSYSLSVVFFFFLSDPEV